MHMEPFNFLTKFPSVTITPVAHLHGAAEVAGSY